MVLSVWRKQRRWSASQFTMQLCRLWFSYAAAQIKLSIAVLNYMSFALSGVMRKVKVDKDQEMAQSERNYLQKLRWGHLN